ncbi:MAG: polyphosphate polymerase domain-containing protein [Lachnospiraceae bacterium]|nr:polyphosphate polymerase domain-containing protein [Lachnospiraceae bacterium]
MMTENIFERYEKKYILSETQYEGIMRFLSGKILEDEYSRATVMSLYYDTPDHRIIRHSLERPVYKEKLRVRCYGVLTRESEAFIELKKKYKGVVYKRRLSMSCAEARDFLKGNDTSSATEGTEQIAREIHAFCHNYPHIAPSILCSCDRYAVRDRTNEELRYTFDHNLRGRTYDLDLCRGVYGEALTADGACILEIKAPGAVPLELAGALDRLQIYPHSFSKVGAAYEKLILHKEKHLQEEETKC